MALQNYAPGQTFSLASALQGAQSIAANDLAIKGAQRKSRLEEMMTQRRQEFDPNDPAAVEQAARTDQDWLKNYQALKQGIDERQREALDYQTQATGRIAKAILAQPPEVQAQAYAHFLPVLKRLQPNAPDQWNEQTAQLAQVYATLNNALSGGDFGKDLKVALGPDGQPVYVQASGAGGVRPVEGYRPLGVEYEAQKARAVQAAKEQTPGGQAALAADRAQATQAQAKAQEAEQRQLKAQQTRERALATIETLLDPQRESAMRSALGPIDARLPTVRQSTADWEADLGKLGDLLTAENLDMLSGVLSDSDMALLRNIAASLPAVSSPERMRRELSEVRRILRRQNANERRALGNAEATKSIGGRTYIKINGEWYQQ